MVDPEPITSLWTTLSCLASFCLGGLGFLALAALLMWIVHRQWRPKDAAALAADRQRAGSQLEQRAAGLRPWTPDALADLSTDWDAKWTRLGRDLNASGTIPSLAEPKGPAWVAFSLRVRGAHRPDGQLLACTTAQALACRITPEGIAVEVDGASLGSIRPDGTLLDAEGRIVGGAPRPGGLPALFRLGSVAKLHDERQRSYPVTLEERVVAHLAHPPAQMMNVISLKKPRFPPAVTLLGTPSEAETTWLLVLAVLQVAAYNLLETVWTN